MATQPQGPVTVKSGSPDADPQKVEGITTPAPEAPETSPKVPETPSGPAPTDKPTSTPESEPGKSEPSEVSFFDPSELPEEIKPYHKQLQAAYTKKTQELAKQNQKIEAYDAFYADPVGSLRRAAEQYGMRMEPVRGVQSQTPTPGMENPEGFPTDWQPQTWEEAFQAFAPRIIKEIQNTVTSSFKPVMDNLKELTTSNVERQLTEIDADWRLYEDNMTENLKAHPTLAKDVAKLYRISVPEEVLTAKATQAALKKFETKAEHAKIQGKSSVQGPTAGSTKVTDFDSAVVAARQEIAKQQ